MSIDKATLSFLETLNQAALRCELQGALAGAATPMDTVFDFARSKGFAVDRQGLEAAHRVLTTPPELGDSELEKVAGGFNPQPEPPGRTALASYSISLEQELLSGW
jgi:hypothetical protein